jgi:hypothetical protein
MNQHSHRVHNKIPDLVAEKSRMWTSFFTDLESLKIKYDNEFENFADLLTFLEEMLGNGEQ